MALPELFVNSPTPGTKTPISTIAATAITGAAGAGITTTPAAGTVESWPAPFVAALPAGLLVAGQFRFQIDREIFLDVTGGSGSTRSVQRGVEGSTPATHAAGAQVFHYLTAAALAAIMTDVAPGVQALGNLPAAQSINFSSLGANLVITGTLTQNTTITFPAATRMAGATALLLITQGGTGNYTLSISDGTSTQAVPVAPTAGQLTAIECVCDAAGNIFIAPLGAQPSLGATTVASAYHNAPATPASGWQLLRMDTVIFDPGANVNTGGAAGYYLAPATGYYQVTGNAAIPATAANQLVGAAIYVNEAVAIEATETVAGSGNVIVGVSALISVTAGQRIELYGFYPVSAAIAAGSPNYNTLSVVRVA